MHRSTLPRLGQVVCLRDKPRVRARGVRLRPSERVMRDACIIIACETVTFAFGRSSTQGGGKTCPLGAILNCPELVVT